MAYVKLLRPEMPLWKKVLLWPWQFAGSIELAVITMALISATLALGTFVEASYNTPTAQAFVYQTWWFNLLNAALAVNVFAAAAIRFPWKRHQTGFVITHVGLLTLIFGALISRLYGIDAQVMLYEGRQDHWAFDQDFHFALTLRDEGGAAPADPAVLAGLTWPTLALATVLAVICTAVGVAGAVATFVRSDRRWLYGGLGLAGLMFVFWGMWVRFEVLYAPTVVTAASRDPSETTVNITFEPGTFTWNEFDDRFRLFGNGALYERLAYGPVFHLARRHGPGDVLYSRDGVTLEVLDYYANSTVRAVPRVELMATVPAPPRGDGGPNAPPPPMTFRPVELTITPANDQPDYPFGFPARESMPGGTATLRLTHDGAEAEAFLAVTPGETIGPKGQVALLVDGTVVRFDVEEKLDAGRFSLAEGWDAEVLDAWPAVEAQAGPGRRLQWVRSTKTDEPISPAVRVRVVRADAPPEAAGETMTLFANTAEDNIPARESGIFGDYWWDFSELSLDRRMATGITNRFDVLQADGPDGTPELLYRLWDRKTIVASGRLADVTEASPVGTFTMAAQTMKAYLRSSDLAATPGNQVFPVPFDGGTPPPLLRPAAKVKLTIDGASEEFWVRSSIGTPGEPIGGQLQEQRLEGGLRGDGTVRLATLRMPKDFLDVGLDIRLQRFERQLDPGTRQPSHYSSTVDFLHPRQTPSLYTATTNVTTWSATQPVAASRVALPKETRSVRDIAVPDTGGILFLLDASEGEITRYDLARQVVEPIEMPKLTAPTAIAVSPDGTRLFWTETITAERSVLGLVRTAAVGSTIGRDGARTLVADRVETVVELPSALTEIAFDPASERIVWLDGQSGEVRAATLGGGTMTTLLERPADGRYAHIAVSSDGGRLGCILIQATGPTELVVHDLRSDSASLAWDQTLPKSTEATGLALPGDGSVAVVSLADVSPPVRIERNGRKWEPRPSRIAITKELSDPGSANAWKTVVADLLGRPGRPAVSQADRRIVWTQPPVIEADAWITMNAPVEIRDPLYGRSYRVFQESFQGPFRPGQPEYEQIVRADENRDDLYVSFLTVNHDPGRGIRNVGCVMVVLGVVVMFYMRAYFFKPKSASSGRPKSPAVATSP